MNCTNINLKKGSKGTQVSLLQTNLKTLKLYDGKIDGDFGSYTLEAVKNFQRKNKLLVDGVFGPISCKKLNSIMNPGGIYTNNTLCEKQGGNCLGQITSYHCGPHSIKQALRKFGITGYTEKTIGSYAGTTTRGTSHSGLETAIAKIAKLEGIKLKVEWKNYSDMGNTQKEKNKKLGELLTDDEKTFFWHELYRKQYGHYSFPKTINTNTQKHNIANSLGSKCNSPAFCGYFEIRTFSEQDQYLKGISQKSICIITKA